MVNLRDLTSVTIGRHELIITWQAQFGPVHPAHTAPVAASGHLPLHDNSGQICIGVTNGAQLPIQHGKTLCPLRLEHHVVDPVIAMHQRPLAVIRWHMRFKSRHELVHRRHRIGFCCAVLLGPARNLARIIVAGRAIIRQANGVHIHIVQGCQDPVHIVKDRAPLRFWQLLQRR